MRKHILRPLAGLVTAAAFVVFAGCGGDDAASTSATSKAAAQKAALERAEQVNKERMARMTGKRE